MARKKMKNKITISILGVILLVVAYVYTTSNPFLLKMGNKHYENGNFKSAVKYYSRIKKKDIDTLMRQGSIEMNSEKHDAAVATFNTIEETAKAQNEEIDLMKLYHDKVMCLKALNKFDAIVDLADDYLKIPKEGRLFNYNRVIEDNIIFAFNYFGKHGERDGFLESLIKGYEGTKDEEHLIYLYQKLSSSYHAEVDYQIRKYIENNPGQESNTGYPFVKNVADKAIEAYDKLINLEPDGLQHYHMKTFVYEKLYGKKVAYEYLTSLRDSFRDNSRYETLVKQYGETLNDFSN